MEMIKHPEGAVSTLKEFKDKIKKGTEFYYVCFYGSFTGFKNLPYTLDLCEVTL